MDKRKVITAYRRGFITAQECAQILGLNQTQVLGLLNEEEQAKPARTPRRQPVNQ